MKKNIFRIFLVSMFVFSLTSCTEWLHTEPRHAISDEAALNDMSGIESTVISMYDIVQSGNYYGRDMLVAGDVLADNAQISVTNTGRFLAHSTNVVGAGFGETVSVWRNAYRVINIANLILDAVGLVADGTPARINQATGEAHFMRGLAYFDLLRIYARNVNHPVGEPLGVIHRLIPFRGFDEHTFGRRSTILEGYQLVESELLAAERLLNNTTHFPYRVSQIAAQALLARLYLYWGRWADAIIYARRVRTAWATLAHAHPWLTPAANHRQIWSATPGTESIWELRYEAGERQDMDNSLQGILMITSPPGNVGYGDVIMRADFLAQFEPGDVRGTIATHNGDPTGMIFRRLRGGETVHYTMKFNGWRDPAVPWWDDVEIIRTAEVQLTLAEALAHPGAAQNLAEARTELNLLRAARGLPPTPAADAGLLEAIIRERRVELVFEGHRWFDLTRLGRDIPKPGGIGTPLAWNDFRTVMRIPLGERDANPNLVQNPGY
ncbi:MAG TPA: RagB/SusD family nutrient uptake outer membrane protein [Bacteroidales bacterium]|nr:RagB/SusD family nutrient uptake outer membrane protein [Bacteroidales bacterium]